MPERRDYSHVVGDARKRLADDERPTRDEVDVDQIADNVVLGED